MIPKFEPVAIIGSHGHPKHVSYLPGASETRLYGSHTRPLYTSDQLAEAYEDGKRDAIPEGWVLVPKQPTFPMLIALNEVAIEVAGLGHSDGPQKILTEGYAAMLAAAPKGEA